MSESVSTKAADEKFCSDCGSAIKTKAEVCPKCGVRQIAHSIAADGKTKVVAALFAFFLGGFGAHKFYLGNTGKGILYLVFCWTLIPSIVAFVEGILFLTMSDESFNQKHRHA